MQMLMPLHYLEILEPRLASLKFLMEQKEMLIAFLFNLLSTRQLTSGTWEKQDARQTSVPERFKDYADYKLGLSNSVNNESCGSTFKVDDIA